MQLLAQNFNQPVSGPGIQISLRQSHSGDLFEKRYGRMAIWDRRRVNMTSGGAVIAPARYQFASVGSARASQPEKSEKSQSLQASLLSYRLAAPSVVSTGIPAKANPD